MYMPFVRIGTIPTKCQPFGEDSDSKSPSFLQHLPWVWKVGHIPLTGGLHLHVPACANWYIAQC